MIKVLSQVLKIDKNWFSQSLIPKESVLQVKDTRRKRILLIICFSLIVLLSFALAVIPHLSTVNEEYQRIGYDSLVYVKLINQLAQSTSIYELLENAFVIVAGGDRPLTMLFLFGLTEIINIDPFFIVEYLPLILGPVLVSITYFLTRELTSNETTSLLAAFLTATSFQVLIGIYAAFIANWVALIIGYLSLIFLFRYVRGKDKRNILLFSVLLITLLFIHVYTWTILTVVMGIFLAVALIFDYYPWKKVTFLLLIVLSSAIVDVIRSNLTGAFGGVERGMNLAKDHLGIEQLSRIWINLVDTTQYKLGSIFGNFIILVLACYWLVRSNLKVDSNLFLGLFLSLGVLPSLFGNWVIQHRLVYDIPFQIPAAIALTCIIKEKRFLIALPLCIWLISISIRTVFNLSPS
jgi:hypothetical protein